MYIYKGNRFYKNLFFGEKDQKIDKGKVFFVNSCYSNLSFLNPTTNEEILSHFTGSLVGTVREKVAAILKGRHKTYPNKIKLCTCIGNLNLKPIK